MNASSIASFTANRGTFRFDSASFFNGLISSGVPAIRARAMRRALGEIGGDDHVDSLQVERTESAYYITLVKDYGAGFTLRVNRKGSVGIPRFMEIY